MKAHEVLASKHFCECLCVCKGDLLYMSCKLFSFLGSFPLSISRKKEPELGNIGGGSCHGTSFLFTYLELSPYSLKCTHVQQMKHNSCNTGGTGC